MSFLLALAFLLVGIGLGALVVLSVARRQHDRIVAERDRATELLREREDLILDQLARLEDAEQRLALATSENRSLTERLQSPREPAETPVKPPRGQRGGSGARQA